MKNIIRFALLLLAFSFAAVPVFSVPSNYTYNYDFWREQVASPDAYRVGAYILGSALGIGHFRDPQGLFIRGNRIYVCDSGNNRIVTIEVQEDGSHVVTAVVSSVIIDGEISGFNYPMDIFENRNGNFYIADTNNNRVLILDRNWRFIHAIYKPDDVSLGDFTDFLPSKLVVDLADRLFVQASNVNKGLMEFDNRFDFSGYMGANRV
ncbi:MAG: hypothetical protein FWC06_08460, partial [Treponema sp.]|nr:hypothetical protein [Treponema sp.]